ncbi:hypothetical protein [Kitasatospora sp. NPDC051164]|uniref:hypothetical protein n=1 Tax=Kitasatospora sp. NPDC051164 TaxID=3364055 RepID=UPI0037B5FC86
MSQRLDVRRMLLKRGWTEGPDGCLRKGSALWVASNDNGDSGLDGADGAYSIPFIADVPARVITAIAETVANDHPSGPTRRA